MPPEMDDIKRSGAPEQRDSRGAMALARREFLKALFVSIATLFVVGLFWLVSHNAPSAGRDPDLTPPAFAPTRTAPASTPTPLAIT